MTQRQWLNEERTVGVELWEDGTMTVMLREKTSDTWGPPVYVKEQDLSHWQKGENDDRT